MDGGYNLRTEDQMEMMMMMMEMEKLPEPSMTPYNETSSGLSGIEFTDANSTRIATIPPFFQNPNVVDSPSSVLCNGTQFQDHFQHNAAPLKFRGISNELSSVNPFSSPLEKRNSMAAMREMIFRMAAMQPVQIDPETVKPPKRRNVKISKDPQSVAARHRRERISEKIRILQRLVPGGTKMDTASMLDEAIHYVKFLKKQVQSLEKANVNFPVEVGFPATATSMANLNYCSFVKACQPAHQNGGFYANA